MLRLEEGKGYFSQLVWYTSEVTQRIIMDDLLFLMDVMLRLSYRHLVCGGVRFSARGGEVWLIQFLREKNKN